MHMHGESHLGRSFNRVVSRVPAYLSVAPEQHVNPAPAVLLTPTLPSPLGLRRVSFYPARTPLDFKTFLAFQLVQHLHPFCLQATRQTTYIYLILAPPSPRFLCIHLMHEVACHDRDDFRFQGCCLNDSCSIFIQHPLSLPVVVIRGDLNHAQLIRFAKLRRPRPRYRYLHLRIHTPRRTKL